MKLVYIRMVSSWKFLIEVFKKKPKFVLFAIECSRGERNGKDVGKKFKPAQIDVKTKEKETKETQKKQTKQVENNCESFTR